MPDGYLLNENDKRLIQELIDRTRERPNSAREEGDQPLNGLECYIAKAPEDGIPPLGPPLGTSSYDEPGSALCTIYNILENWGGSTYYLSLVGTSIQVFNISTGWIGVGEGYVLVHQTSGGKFVAVAIPSGDNFTQDVPSGCFEIEDGYLTQRMKRWTIENGLIVSRESIPSCSVYVCCETGTADDTGTSTSTSELDCNAIEETPACFRLRINGVPGITGPFDLRRGCGDNYTGCSWTTIRDVGDYGCGIAQIRIDFLEGPDRVVVEFNYYPVGSRCFHGANQATFIKTFADFPIDSDTELDDIPYSSQAPGATCDWSGGTIDLEPIPAEDCASEDDSETPGSGGGTASDPCTYCSGVTPATKAIDFSGILQIVDNPCLAAVLNALSIEVDQHDTESCKWELTGIEDGPCGLESVSYTMDPFQWLVSLSFNGGGHTVQFRLAGGGTHDCTAPRVLTFDAEYTGGGAVADFSGATATVT